MDETSALGNLGGCFILQVLILRMYMFQWVSMDVFLIYSKLNYVTESSN